MPTKIYLVIESFMNMGAVNAVLCSGGGSYKWVFTHISNIYCPRWVKFGVGDTHVMLLSIFESRESRGREGPPFLKGVYELSFIRVLWYRMPFC